MRSVSKHELQGAVMVDHICFKCGSGSEYEQVRAVLEASPATAYIYQVQLSGRRVAYVGLREGIVSVNNPIRFVELSDKKPGADEAGGFHHAEIYPMALEYHQLIERLEDGGETVQLQVRPHHTTHDLVLPGGFILRFTQRPLIEKIVEEQMSLIVKGHYTTHDVGPEYSCSMSKVMTADDRLESYAVKFDGASILS